MHDGLMLTLLDLADATSQNLDFAHRPDVHVSYGEETITETNLLELCRRHPGRVKLTSFSKKKEAGNGADWEWHVIGRYRRLVMRVQAKRVQANGVLKIGHIVKSSLEEQIDLLIADARLRGFMPVYCLYSAEPHRVRWKTPVPGAVTRHYEYGCLLASADRVKTVAPTKLTAIEGACIPWHYLVERRRLPRPRDIQAALEGDIVSAFYVGQHMQADQLRGQLDGKAVHDFPTIAELNRRAPPEPSRDRRLEGIFETPSSAGRLIDTAGYYEERGIRMVLELDVSDAPFPEPDAPPLPPRPEE